MNSAPVVPCFFKVTLKDMKLHPTSFMQSLGAECLYNLSRGAWDCPPLLVDGRSLMHACCLLQDNDRFQYMHLDLYDTTDADIGLHFEPVSEFISSALDDGGTVLVHCYAGQSRSAALLAAHLMLRSGLPLGKALAKLQAARPLGVS